MAAPNATFEHEETRRSLQNAFESIFARFDRDFVSDDEVDIDTMTVIKRGRRLEEAPFMPFGSVFRKPGEAVSSDADTISSDESDEDGAGPEMPFDHYFVSISRQFVLARDVPDWRIREAFEEALKERLVVAEPFKEVCSLLAGTGAASEFDDVLLSRLIN